MAGATFEVAGGTPRFRSDEVLVAFASRDSEGKRDATGAFIPEARTFARVHAIDTTALLAVDNTLPPMRRARILVDALRARPAVRCLALFCHGFQHGTQLSPRSPGHPAFSQGGNPELWRQYVAALSRCVNVSVVLYACSTGDDPDDDPETAPGSGDGGYADLLRDGLCASGAPWCRVVAHTTAAHATQNPHVKFFEGRGSRLGGTGAAMLVPPSHMPTFAKMLRTEFRFRFPFMSLEEVGDLVLDAERLG